jgi:Uma2 family endonuclease
MKGTTKSQASLRSARRRPRKQRMPVLTLMKRTDPFGPDSNGILMTPEEFDSADFEEGWRYELINGVLIVTPLPLLNESDPNDELGHLLRNYQEQHPQGSSLNPTVPERTVKTGSNRRRADRVVWAGLGRLPRRGEVPTIVVEFVGARRRDRVRDYETKRDEYLGIRVKEYWVIDRFMQTMTVFSRVRSRPRERVIAKGEIYTTDLLPGFELSLARLFALADRWSEDQPE